MTDLQPIQTAPKDGTLVRLQSEEHSPSHLFFWDNGKWVTIIHTLMGAVKATWPDGDNGPTHWMEYTND